ncbi:MAG TPA: aminotransferase class V-fold PLP-dependent enzyme [Kofleriaceae bacterium]|nr:aminotransferase class V-fold PLP-dependent enzyme [Kofleriaceae bacterium]
MPTRRDALGVFLLPFACAPHAAPKAALPPPPPKGRSLDELARDEDYWAEVGRAFTIDRAAINLNNAAVSPSPAVVQQALARHLAYANSMPTAHALWTEAPALREAVRRQLATQWGVDAEEIAITRSASEGLQICQMGIDLQRGDEVLATTQDYPRMLTTFKQRERREGIVLRQFKINVPLDDPSKLVALYESNITPRTKLILVTHVMNLTGIITPVRELVAMARRRGIPVIVDGAHSFAHLDFKLSDLDCDYFATSLHKWLFAPLGTGLLYVRRSKIRGLWPLTAATEDLTDNIRKFEEVGTRPEANALAIAEAVTFHQALGGARKQARLLYLRDTWAHRLRAADPRVRLYTSLAPRAAGNIVLIDIDGVDPMKLWAYLWDKHRIQTGAVVRDEFRGLRVAPNVYTTLPELDRFCSVMETVVRQGLPA